MLLLFMYALGLKVGPQFFSGLRKGGLAFVGIGLIIWSLNWVICYFGAALVGLAPGYATALAPPLLSLALVVGAIGGVVSLGAAPAALLSGLFAFGVAALLFLATEERLAEARETADTPLLAAMLFIGFFALYALDAIH